MDAVLRGASIYLFLLVLFRIAGRRSLSKITTFDFVLLLVIGEATQQALLGEDFSVTNAFIVICVLVAIDILLGLVASKSELFSKIMNGVPMVLVEDGVPLTDRMRKARVDVAEILEAARERQGLERLEQIKFAVLEVTGQITIIPREASRNQ